MTVEPEQELAPGCFGSAMTYKATARECRECPFVASCAPLSERRLAELRRKLGIVLPFRRPSDLKEISVKAQALVNKIRQRNIAVVEVLRNGVNPFGAGEGFTFLRVTCHLLLRFPQGITRETLRDALMRKLKWTHGTATAHVVQAVQALTSLNAIVESHGRIKLKDKE